MPHPLDGWVDYPTNSKSPSLHSPLKHPKDTLEELPDRTVEGSHRRTRKEHRPLGPPQASKSKSKSTEAIVRCKFFLPAQPFAHFPARYEAKVLEQPSRGLGLGLNPP